jgi:hypothetical protein
MAFSRITNPVKTVTSKQIIAAFTVTPKGASAPSYSPTDFVSGVVRDSAGAFTITLRDTFSQLDSFTTSVKMATDDGYCSLFGPVDLTAKTVKLFVNHDNAASDIADGYGYVGVTLYLRK